MLGARAQWSLRLFIYALLITLAACGESSSTSSGSTPTATVALTQTYTGNGFSISYPADWKTTTANGVIGFTSSDQSYVLNVPIVDFSAATSADDALSKSIAAENLQGAQDAQPDSPTVTIAGETWPQKAITGTNSNGLKVMYEVAATSHPVNDPTGKWFLITREAATDKFTQANTNYFQPMIATFKFTS